jgi:hypothetical protein
MRVSEFSPNSPDAFLFQYNFPDLYLCSGITKFPPIPDLVMSRRFRQPIDLDDHVGLSAIPIRHSNGREGNKEISVANDTLTHGYVTTQKGQRCGDKIFTSMPLKASPPRIPSG